MMHTVTEFGWKGLYTLEDSLFKEYDLHCDLDFGPVNGNSAHDHTPPIKFG